jgi:hypothetical protein
MGAVLYGTGTTLTHTLGSRLDTGHGNLGNWKFVPEMLRKVSRKE